MSPRSSSYGFIGEFRAPEQVAHAARELHAAGFRNWEVYGPAPIDEITHLVPTHRGRAVTIAMVVAALVGACFGYFIQYWDAVLSYPLNVGGRPLNGWPGFVPSAWEICALFTVYGGFFALLAACRLPRLYHPIFAAPHFERASQDRFFVCVPASEPLYDLERIRSLFMQYGALSTAELTQ
ncbi:MAG TPA: DUF3341 domain-containing protein [Steroidobacteraceae bacterium]|nr:DUF3341 domain-containing protein [Steroidobacteraceae bacterium]